MKLNQNQTEGLKQIGIDADTLFDIINKVLNKYQVWGYIDYIFDKKEFFWVIQYTTKSTLNYTEVMQQDTSYTFEDSASKLIDELIKTVKSKKLTNP